MHKNQLERKTVSVEELALSNAYQLEAMINVLKRKGIDRLKSQPKADIRLRKV